MLDVNNSLEFGGIVPDVIKFKFLIAVSLINLLTNSLISNGILFVGSSEQIVNSIDYKLKSIKTYFYKKI